MSLYYEKTKAFEEELEQAQGEREALERELAAREKEISSLSSELEAYSRKYSSVSEELSYVSQENQKLAEENGLFSLFVIFFSFLFFSFLFFSFLFVLSEVYISFYLSYVSFPFSPSPAELNAKLEEFEGIQEHLQESEEQLQSLGEDYHKLKNYTEDIVTKWCLFPLISLFEKKKNTRTKKL